MPENRDEFLTLGEAQDRLGVSRFKITQLVKEGKLTVYRSDLDRREKLVKVSELDALTKPKSEDTPGKIAA